PDIGAGLDQRGGLLGRHHLLGQASMPDVREIRHRRKPPSPNRAPRWSTVRSRPCGSHTAVPLVRWQVPRRCVVLVLTLATVASPCATGIAPRRASRFIK